jgi:hypothetical protein
MMLRFALVIVFIPLCAFSCVSVSSLVVRLAQPTIPTPATQTVELLAHEYTAVLADVEGWALQNHYEKYECSKEGPTPLCKKFEKLANKGRLEVLVDIDPATNRVEVLLTDWKSSNELVATERGAQLGGEPDKRRKAEGSNL